MIFKLYTDLKWEKVLYDIETTFISLFYFVFYLFKACSFLFFKKNYVGVISVCYLAETFYWHYHYQYSFAHMITDPMY